MLAATLASPCQTCKNPGVRALLISPEFEGIKTRLPTPVQAVRARALLISPEFEGIKTFPPGPAPARCRRATDQPRIRGD